MEPLLERKPARWPFLIYTLALRVLVLALITAIAAYALNALFSVPPLYAWLVFALLALLAVVWRGARYKKERYRFFADRLVVHTGSVFSDHKTELAYNRVTHVTHTRPWLEHLFFGTGAVSVESAGSRGAEAVIRSVADSEEIYERLEALLRENGFSLEKSELLHEEQPHALAVVLDVLGTFGALVLVAFWLVADLGLSASMAVLGFLEGYLSLTLGAAALLGLVLLAVLFFAYIRYQDLSRRTYRVYSDCLAYEEGFLTRVESFLPAENLSDSETTQGWLGRLFGLYDVKVSAQGSGTEIKFLNLKRGREVDDAIDRIIDEHQTPIRKASAQPRAEKTARKQEPPTSPAATGTYRPAWKRVLLPLLLYTPLLAAPIIYVFIAGAYALKAFTVTYTLKPGRIVYEKRFIATKRVEFTSEKITEVVFAKNPLDHLMDTMTVKIKSIGSGENVTLYALPDTQEMREGVLSVDNISEQDAKSEHAARWSLPAFLISTWPWLLALVIAGLAAALFLPLLADAAAISGNAFPAGPVFTLVTAGLALLYVLAAIGTRLWYGDALLSEHDGYLRYKEGWGWTRLHYARYDAIKDVSTKQYWLRTDGALTVNIAGEETTGQKNNQSLRSTRFTAAYTPQAFSAHDKLLSSLGASAQEEEFSVSPQARNTALVLIVFLPLIVFVPFLLWSYAKRSYHVFSDRVETRRGVFSRTRKTVLFSMVDHVRRNEGFLHKLFGNGAVRVYTTGSSGAELSLGPVREHERLAEWLERLYS